MSTISYSRKGSGEPVLLIHGIGHRRQAWHEVFDLLAADFDVIAIDLPGFGESPVPVRPDGFRMRSYAEQIERFVDELGIKTPHVVGNSLGGYLALVMAARGTARTVTALSPAGFWNQPELMVTAANLISMRLASRAPGPMVRAFAEKPALRKISMRALYMHPEKLTAQDALDDTLNLRRSKAFWPVLLRAIRLTFNDVPKVPTMIAWGDHDRLLSPRQARRAQRRLLKLGAREVSHTPLPDCGHVPMLDHPDLVARVARQTIARVTERAEAVA